MQLKVLSNICCFLLLLIFKDKNVKSKEKTSNLSLNLSKSSKIVVKIYGEKGEFVFMIT